MKLFAISLLLIMTLACNRSDSDLNKIWMQIEVKAPQNLDCHIPEIIFLSHKQEAYTILGDDRGTYVAIGLPGTVQQGDRFFVQIEKPGRGGIVACTHMGTSWAQVRITRMQ